VLFVHTARPEPVEERAQGSWFDKLTTSGMSEDFRRTTLATGYVGGGRMLRSFVGIADLLAGQALERVAWSDYFALRNRSVRVTSPSGDVEVKLSVKAPPSMLNERRKSFPRSSGKSEPCT
jgi:hypothetical protein